MYTMRQKEGLKYTQLAMRFSQNM